jgi:hypothetical protein
MVDDVPDQDDADVDVALYGVRSAAWNRRLGHAMVVRVPVNHGANQKGSEVLACRIAKRLRCSRWSKVAANFPNLSALSNLSTSISKS